MDDVEGEDDDPTCPGLDAHKETTVLRKLQTDALFRASDIRDLLRRKKAESTIPPPPLPKS